MTEHQAISVSVNFSREVLDYFEHYDLSGVADQLLDMIDFTNLPECVYKRTTYRTVTITNETFITLYNSLGPRNKKVSLARVFEFGYNVDVLSLDRFQQYLLQDEASSSQQKRAVTLVYRAYRALCEAQHLDNSETLREITSLVYNYYKKVKEV